MFVLWVNVQDGSSLLMALHYVGFGDDRIWNARRIWGEPDFYHRIWDVRAWQEIMPGDIAIFAHGTYNDPPSTKAWDASEQANFAIGIDAEAL